MPRPQLPHDLKGDLIIAAKDAIRLLLQRSLQCIERLPGRFHTGMNEPLVYWHTKFRESTQITAYAVGVDGVDGTAHQQRDPLGAQLQKDACHLAGSRDLIVVCLRDGLVLAASDEHKRCLVLPQKFDAGIIRHGVGQDHAVHLVVGQLPLQLRILGVGGVAKHQVIAALVCHGADAAHALAQKGQIQRNKPLRYDHGNIVGAQFFAALCRNRLGAGTPHIGVHLGAGLLADASLSGKCTRYRCFRNAKRISHLLDRHFFGFLCSHRISSPFHRTAQQCATPAYRGKPALSSMKANKKRSAFSAER